MSILNSVFSRQETSVSLFFQGNSLVLLVGSYSSTFSFYLTFFVSLDVGETVIYFDLKGQFYVGASQCSLSECNNYTVRAVFGMEACHLFSLCVLAIIPLLGGAIGVVLNRDYSGH